MHSSVHQAQPSIVRSSPCPTPPGESILERLASGPATIGELARPFDLTLNSVKKHVGILESVDLVITAKVGRSRERRLGPAQLENATNWIEDYRRAWWARRSASTR
jgi:DNA-binding transcriptional ArsR family regulator